METLPPELLSHIIFYPSEDDRTQRETLASLSLTSSFFLPFCRAILFKHIKLAAWKATEGQSPGDTLLGFIEKSPQILCCINELTIDASQEWLAVDAGFARVVERMDLSTLTSLKIVGRGRGLSSPPSLGEWDTYDLAVQRALVKLYRGPALTKVCLSKAPMALCRLLGPSVKHIDVQFPCNGSFRALEEDLAVDGGRGADDVFLESVTVLVESDDLLGKILDPQYPFRFGSLKKLEADMLDSALNDWGQLYPILHLCTGSLESLVVKTYGYYSETDRSPFDFERFMALRTLELGISVLSHQIESDPNPFVALKEFLLTIRKAPTITELRLVMADAFVSDFNITSLEEGINGYLELALDPSRFPCVTRFEVEMEVIRAILPHTLDSLKKRFRETCCLGRNSELDNRIVMTVTE